MDFLSALGTAIPVSFIIILGFCVLLAFGFATACLIVCFFIKMGIRKNYHSKEY